MFPDSIEIPATLPDTEITAMAVDAMPLVNSNPNSAFWDELEMSGTDPAIIATMESEALHATRQDSSTALNKCLNEFEFGVETQASGSGEPINSNVIPSFISTPVTQPVVLVTEVPNSMPEEAYGPPNVIALA